MQSPLFKIIEHAFDDLAFAKCYWR